MHSPMKSLSLGTAADMAMRLEGCKDEINGTYSTLLSPSPLIRVSIVQSRDRTHTGSLLGAQMRAVAH